MRRTWTIIAVKDVVTSFTWYQRLLAIEPSEPAHDHFGQIADNDGEVLLCLHSWGEHAHPSLTSPATADPGNGLLLFIRVENYEECLGAARRMAATFVEEPNLSPNTGTMEFSVRDPDGYYVTISSLR